MPAQKLSARTTGDSELTRPCHSRGDTASNAIEIPSILWRAGFCRNPPSPSHGDVKFVCTTSSDQERYPESPYKCVTPRLISTRRRERGAGTRHLVEQNDLSWVSRRSAMLSPVHAHSGRTRTATAYRYCHWSVIVGKRHSKQPDRSTIIARVHELGGSGRSVDITDSLGNHANLFISY